MSESKRLNREAFLPLYVGDFLAATGEWDGEEQALYLLMLGHQWVLGSLPCQESALARLSKYDKERFSTLWHRVSSKFEIVNGRLQNVRLEEHRQHSHDISRRRREAGQRGATARWHGKTDDSANGKPMANAKDLPMANAWQLPNFCHGINQSINQSIVTTKSSTTKKAQAPVEIDVPGLDRESWDEWIAYRKSIGKTLKPRSLKAAAEEMAALGPRQAAAVKHSIANGYQGLFPPKPAEKPPPMSAVEKVRQATGVDLRLLTGVKNG